MKPQLPINNTLPSQFSGVPVDRADDIGDLFRQFGAEPASYQEDGQENRAIAAQSRWPLLGRLRIGKEESGSVATPASFRPVIVVAPIDGAGPKSSRSESLSQLFQRLVGDAPAPQPLSSASQLYTREKF